MKVESNMIHWIISANSELYDHQASFEQYSYIDWKQTAYYKVGDIVYIYSTQPIGRVQYKTRVVQTDLSFDEIRDDQEFWEDEEKYHQSKDGLYARLKLIAFVDREELSLDYLLANGLNGAPQGPTKLIDDRLGVIDYIERYFNHTDRPNLMPEEYRVFSNGKGYSGEGIYRIDDDSLTVLKGSQIVKEETESYRKYYGASARTKAELVEKGIIHNQKFTEDYTFESVFQAASILSSNGKAGNKSWKTEDGKTIEELLAIHNHIEEFKNYATGFDHENKGKDPEKYQQTINDFKERFPLEELPNLPIEQYDQLGSKDTLAYAIEHGTDYIFSGFLGTNRNKIVFHVENDEYDTIGYLKKSYSNKSVKEIYQLFIKSIYSFIKDFEPNTYSKGAIGALPENTNIIRSKLLALYRPNSILSMGSKRWFEEIFAYFGLDSSNTDAVMMNLKLIEFMKQIEIEGTLMELSDIIGHFYNERVENQLTRLTEGQWLDFLEDLTVYSTSSLIAMKALLHHDGQATCTQLANKYGKKKNFYKVHIEHFARKVAELIGKENFPESSFESSLNLLITREDAPEEVPGSHYWILRPELENALKQIDLSAYSIYDDGDLAPKLDVDFNQKIDFDSLYFEDAGLLKSQIQIALKSGKDIILIGPPGTGKSKIAQAIADSYDVEYKMVTAMSDWSSYDTIGGYKPDDKGSLYFEEGIFLSALQDKEKSRKSQWLIIDEINRADIDKAFGPFLSALSGDNIELGLKDEEQQNIELVLEDNFEENVAFQSHQYVIPRDWRIIGTMNTFDKTSLYEMSYAFMRRFAFIPVSIPRKINADTVKVLCQLWEVDSFDDYRNMAKLWIIINDYRKIGPAIVEDLAQFIALGGDYISSIVLYVLPQLEGLYDTEIEKFFFELKELAFIYGQENEKEMNIQRLRIAIEDFFDIKLSED